MLVSPVQSYDLNKLLDTSLHLILYLPTRNKHFKEISLGQAACHNESLHSAVTGSKLTIWLIHTVNLFSKIAHTRDKPGIFMSIFSLEYRTLGLMLAIWAALII